MKSKFALFLFAMVAATAATDLSAAVVVKDLESDNTWYVNGGQPGSSANPSYWQGFTTTNNVLFGLTATNPVGNFSAEAGTGTIASLTDGVSPPTKAGLATVGGTGGTQVTYTLLSPTQLSSIGYYGGWTDSGRSDALFNVSYSTDGGSTYTLLLDPDAPDYTVVVDPARQNLTIVGTGGYDAGRTFSKYIGGDGVVSNFINITDSTGTIGNGALVTNLQFDFFGGRNGFNGAMELAAYSPVPEPTVASLCVLGTLVGFVGRRRR